MAKRYVTVTVESASEDGVARSLGRLIGPLMPEWRTKHFVGIHLDILDVTSAIEYGRQVESAASPERPDAAPSARTIDIDLYSRSELPVKELQVALAHAIAAGISADLKTSAVVSDDHAVIARYLSGAVVPTQTTV